MWLALSAQPNPAPWLATQAGRFACLGMSAVSRKDDGLSYAHIKSFFDQALSIKKAGYWRRFLFKYLWTSIHKHAKNEI